MAYAWSGRHVEIQCNAIKSDWLVNKQRAICRGLWKYQQWWWMHSQQSIYGSPLCSVRHYVNMSCAHTVLYSTLYSAVFTWQQSANIKQKLAYLFTKKKKPTKSCPSSPVLWNRFNLLHLQSLAKTLLTSIGFSDFTSLAKPIDAIKDTGGRFTVCCAVLYAVLAHPNWASEQIELQPPKTCDL